MAKKRNYVPVTPTYLNFNIPQVPEDLRTQTYPLSGYKTPSIPSEVYGPASTDFGLWGDQYKTPELPNVELPEVVANPILPQTISVLPTVDSSSGLNMPTDFNPNSFNFWGALSPDNMYTGTGDTGFSDWNTFSSQTPLPQTFGSQLKAMPITDKINSGLGVFNAASGLWNSFNMYKAHKANLDFQKDSYNKQYVAQAKSYNSRLADRQAKRVANGRATMGVDEYVGKYGIKGV